ncbi:HAD-IIA family hydrolase [Amycolatopsis sp. PS_44_ISF1]|uniref:HAD-IIA family hydrolase n=1 Tax=Amycolatopsis sp. PS_44_ISF1 TaxID=2974917 RepID=UPI0028DFF513|nr:HAD-IIA family hydrolase [Amycolatopsis sp. PS_44_ISF1]MDT8912411.1 HAD-IIA family hydrolase [Amycolatopsis sp. PS_44_ISF1]
MSRLLDRHDLILLDVDGVLVLGRQPIPGAAETIAAIRAKGVPLRFTTNSPRRRPGEVAEMLNDAGIGARADEVTTPSAIAAAALAHRLPPGAAVLVVGSGALWDEVAAAGLRPVDSADDEPQAVVQGFDPAIGWPVLAEAALVLHRPETLWVATNLDDTWPAERGVVPGNGALMAVLTTTTGRRPDLSAGKPEPTMFRQQAELFDARKPLVIGDRLDTDIEGGLRAGFDTLLVLTGVTDRAAMARAHVRPTHVGESITHLLAESAVS